MNTTMSASYLALQLELDICIEVKLYKNYMKKRDDFDFPIVNFVVPRIK